MVMSSNCSASPTKASTASFTPVRISLGEDSANAFSAPSIRSVPNSFQHLRQLKRRYRKSIPHSLESLPNIRSAFLRDASTSLSLWCSFKCLSIVLFVTPVFSASATAVIVLLVNTRQPMAGDLDWSEFLMIGFTHHMEILSKVKELDARKFYIHECAIPAVF